MERLTDTNLPVQERREIDLNFHMVIAKASGNNLLVVLSQAMQNVFQKFMFLDRDISTQDSIGESILFHRRILDALIKHDPKEAEQAMREHLCTALKNVEKSLQKN